MTMKVRGFTLFELVVIIVILGVLAITGYARFQGGQAFEARGARDELASAFRMAQRYAITSGCDVQVGLSSNSYSVMVENAPCGSGAPSFGTAVQSPAGDGNLSGTFDGVVISPTGNHVYDAYGDLASGGGSIGLSSGGDTAGFTVHAGSGFVDLP